MPHTSYFGEQNAQEEDVPSPRAFMCALVGRGLFVAWMALGIMPGSSLDGGEEDARLFVALRCALLLGLIVCSFVPLLAWRTFDRTRTRVCVIAFAHALGAAGCLIYALAASGAVPRPVQFAATACTVIAIPLAGPIWGELFSHFPHRLVVRMTLGGLVVTSIVLVLVRTLPLFASSALLVCLPLASGGLFFLARKGLVPRPCRDPSLPWRGMQPSFRLLIGCFAAMVAAGILTGHSEFSDILSVDSFVASFAIAALVILVSLRLESRVDYATVDQVLVAGMALGFAGFVLGGTSLQSACAHLIATAQQCLGVVMWLALLRIARTTCSNPYFVMGAGLAAVNAGPALGLLLGMLVLRPIDVMSVSSLLLLFGALWCFSTAKRPVEVHIDPNVVFESKVKAFSEAYKLTPRERDVLRYWVSGRQLAYVADTLGVAKNTAKTHVLHVYQKSGVNNKEELMRLFDEYGSREVEVRSGMPENG